MHKHLWVNSPFNWQSVTIISSQNEIMKLAILYYVLYFFITKCFCKSRYIFSTYNKQDYYISWEVIPHKIGFQVAWLRVDTQTILTIHSHVITKNHRIAVTHSEHRTWYLHIRDVRETDRGWYMCQINTDPMKSQVGYLNVVGKFYSFWFYDFRDFILLFFYYTWPAGLLKDARY